MHLGDVDEGLDAAAKYTQGLVDVVAFLQCGAPTAHFGAPFGPSQIHLMGNQRGIKSSERLRDKIREGQTRNSDEIYA